MKNKIIFITNTILIIFFSVVIIMCFNTIKYIKNKTKKNDKNNDSIMFKQKEKFSAQSDLPGLATKIGTAALTTQSKTISEAINEINTNKELSHVGYWPLAGQTISLSEYISKQNNGIIVMWSGYSSSTAQNWGWQACIIPKYFVSVQNGKGVSCLLANSDFKNMAAKYIYVYDNQIVGNNNNSKTGTQNGVTYDSAYITRYVIGF